MSPYAKDIHEEAKQKFLFYGNVGSGKTTLCRSLPGRKFLYMFDPAGLNSIKPVDDIYYETFMPDAVSMTVATLKGIRDVKAPTYAASETYVRWEKDFELRLSQKFFTDPNVEIDRVRGGFDTIILDSLTTLSDLIMDRILEINNRSGKNPEVSDYGVLAMTIKRIVRNAAATGCYVALTAHEQADQDKLLRTVSNKIMVPGQLKITLPILFSDIWHTKVDRDSNGKVKYLAETIPVDMYPTMRCSLDLPTSIDVTIPHDCADPTKFGIGAILRSKGLWNDFKGKEVIK
jgi:GTPase SAR1 family protein